MSRNTQSAEPEARRRRVNTGCAVVLCVLIVAAGAMAQNDKPADDPGGYAPAVASQTVPAPTRTWGGLRVPAELLAVAPAAPVPSASAFPHPAAPPAGVRKAPLIIGIAGAVVMVVGIAVATSDDSFVGVRAAGVATAVVGGAVAVTGFYFAFRR